MQSIGEDTKEAIMGCERGAWPGEDKENPLVSDQWHTKVLYLLPSLPMPM